MNDIIPPPKRPLGSVTRSRVAPEPKLPETPEVSTEPTAPLPTSRRRSRRKLVAIIVGLIVLLFAAVTATSVWWYQEQLKPVSTDKNAQKVRVVVATGATSDSVASTLLNDKLIRSKDAFKLYVQLNGLGNKLKVGVYGISPNESIPKILEHLTSGKTEEMSITFYPGATLKDPSSIADKKRTDVVTMLSRAGFTDEEIASALAATYDQPTLFADRPAGSSLEGYVYGDTYNFAMGASAEAVLGRTFDEFARVIKENDLVALYKKQGLTLYQGIVFASIVQREVTDPEDEKVVAQIFLDRWRNDMALGSDVTYEYIAKQTGAVASPDLDSPYNTRKVTGLPPGPIAAPGLSALLAVANPADTDYVYFVSGDDDVTYFAKTNEEHEANVAAHCHTKCQ